MQCHVTNVYLPNNQSHTKRHFIFLANSFEPSPGHYIRKEKNEKISTLYIIYTIYICPLLYSGLKMVRSYSETTGCPTRSLITGWLADRCSVSQQLDALQTHTTDTHYRHIPLHFSHTERTPVQISLQYLHWC